MAHMRPAPPRATSFTRRLPAIFTTLISLWLVAGLFPGKAKSPFDLRDFGELPVLNGGRTKPLDTIARNSLLILSGKQTVRTPEGSLKALTWLVDVLFKQDKAAAYKVFTIDNPDVLGAMGIVQTSQRRFSWNDLQAHAQEIERQAMQADSFKPGQRTPYQRAILNLHSHINLYQKLQNTLQIAGTGDAMKSLRDFETRLGPALKAHMSSSAHAKGLMAPFIKDLERYRFLDEAAEFYPLPPAGWWKQESWMTYGNGVLSRIRQDAFHPAVLAYAQMGDAWRADESEAFNQAIADYRLWLTKMARTDAAHGRREFIFNHFQAFYRSLVIYVLALILASLSWIFWPRELNRTAFALLVLAFGAHTLGLACRVILQGRPPVTNLYSSAIFVGWVAVLLGLILERLHRNGVGSAVGSAIGFITLIIAHHLATTGDTMEMMRAVLDSNFWLATHVVTITIGYGSTFLSGFLAVVSIIRQRYDRSWTEQAAASIERMVYGVVCFSLFFSFLGTILGGIWADQSWGRFWGWDPKENGALLIVLWNALILHARIGNFCGRAGILAMAVFGNVVTAFSWFGVNMLGIGLHSYGFMDKAFFWIVAFSASQIAVIALGRRSRD